MASAYRAGGRPVNIVGRLTRALLLVLVLILLPPLLLLALLSSESGSDWSLQQAARMAQALGMELSLEHEAGSLLDRVQLKAVHFQGFGVDFSAEQLVLQWSPGALLERNLHVQTLQLQDVSLVLPPSTEKEAGPPQIPAIDLPVAVRIDQLGVVRLRILQGDTEQQFAALSLAASLDHRRLELRSLDVRMEGIRLGGELGMSPTAPHPIDGRLAVDVHPQLTGDDVGPVSGIVNLAGDALAPQIDLSLNMPRELHVKGRLRLDRIEPEFNLLAEWPELAWPLTGEGDVRAAGGRLVLEGKANDYRLELSAQLDGKQLPPSALEMRAHGDLGGLRIELLRLVTLGGELLAKGAVSWERVPSWDLLIDAHKLDPGRYLADWPGSIDGRVQLRGELAADGDGGLELQAGVEQLSGRLRDQPFEASGQLVLSGGRVQAERVQIASGPNRVVVNGEAGERLDLAFAVDAPDLRSAYPGLAGRLMGKGQISGHRAAPAVVASLNGGQLGYQGSRVGVLKLDIDWRENGGSVNLRAEDLETDGRTVADLRAEASGSPAAHRITASAQAEGFAVALVASGGLRDEAWQGELSQFELRENSLGEWGLESPARLELAKRRVRTGRLCLAQAETRVCGEGGWHETAGLDLTGRLSNLDLARLATLLPGEAEVTGRLDGALEAKGPLARPEIRFELRPSDGLVRFPQDIQPVDIRYRDARLDGVFKDDQGRMELRFDLHEKGRAQGTVSLGPDNKGQRALAGKIGADFPDLGLVAGFVPAIEQVTGRLHIESELTGTLASPRVSGSLQVLDASAKLPPAGIALSDISLVLEAVGNAPVRVLGGMQSGEGRIRLEGEIDPWSAAGPRVDLQIAGQDFQVARLPEALVDISPDLRLQGAGTYHLSGVLKIPRSNIMLRELPRSSVAVSDDEIVVGEQTEMPRGTAPKNLTAGVRVELGDEVSFNGFGLETGLTGAVDATTGTGGTRLDGKIELRDAKYRAYGQELKVEQGRLIFTGVPSNPDVDLRAVRESRNGQVQAFLAVSGPLSRPNSRVYSQPALPEAEALAYLLTGRGLDQVGQGEGADIAAAALALGMSKGDPLLQDLGDRFGLDELSLEGGAGGIEDSSLLLGKYLNPDLYLGYSQSLFNPEGAVLLRLRLGERLELESRSGNEQSVDLFYRLEHD